MTTAVKLYKKSFTLEMPALRPADPNPMIPALGYRAIYPYTRTYAFETHPTSQKLNALVVENNRLHIEVVPALGGRIWSTENKATGQPLFFAPHRVGLLNFGLRGAWYIGGVEFNFPNGHTVDALETVPAALRRYPSGGGGVVIGDVDLVWRVSWQVSARLEADSSNLYLDILLANPTPHPVRYMWWINTAVPVDDSLEYFNQTTDVFAHFVGRRFHLSERVSWPLHEGQDFRRYFTYREPTSLFHLSGDDRWFGYYSHNNHEGVLRIGWCGDAPGLKIWNSGQSQEAFLWGKWMTAGLKYANSELQSGRPETQTDYGILPPHYCLSWTEIWRPVWHFDKVTCASEYLTLATSARQDELELLLLADKPYPGSTIQIRQNNQQLITQTVDLPADNPLRLTVRAQGTPRDFDIQVFASDGTLLLDYQPAEDSQRRSAIADILIHASQKERLPQEMSAEELCVEARRLERANLPLGARQLALRSLKLDSGNSQAHLLLARLDLRQGNFASAREHCIQALKRDEHLEWAQYFLALSYLLEENYEQALVEFERAAGRAYASASACWFQLGQLYLRRADWQKAIAAFDRCLKHEANHPKARFLQAVALRRLGLNSSYSTSLINALMHAPLAPLARMEVKFHTQPVRLPDANEIEFIEWRPPERIIQEIIEAACDYLNSGLYQEALSSLEQAVNLSPQPHPMVYYLLGYCHDCLGNRPSAQEAWKKAASHPAMLTFCSREEEARAIRAALEAQPEDALGWTLLGMYALNRLNFSQAKETIEKALVHRSAWDTPWRLKAIYHKLQGEKDEAIYAYYHAIEHNPSNPRLYLELDELLEEMPQSQKSRKELWEIAPASVKEDDFAFARFISALIANQEYQIAIHALKERTFFPEEGSGMFRDLFVQANLYLALHNCEIGNWQAAFQFAQSALEYPENLGLGQPFIRYDAPTFLLLAGIAMQQGQRDSARSWLERAADEPHREINTAEYFKGKALQWIGNEASANTCFQRLLHQAEMDLAWPERDHAYAELLALLGRMGKERQTLSLDNLEQISPKYHREAALLISIDAFCKQNMHPSMII